jgi:hypothetical protein
MNEINYLKFEEVSKKLQDILSPGFIEMMFETCVVALDSKEHASGKELKSHIHSENIYKNPLKLFWEKEIDERMKRSHHDAERTTDFAAMYLTLSLFCTLEELKEFIGEDEFEIETSAKGSGVDFWISRKSIELNYIARVEISGIRNETQTNTMEIRLSKKQNQVKKSSGTNLPVFISIIEFSNPKSLITYQN